MTFLTLLPEQLEPEPETPWKKDRPKERILYVEYLDVIQVLDVIGPYVESLQNDCELADLLPLEGTPGVYIFEGGPKTIRYPEGDYDLELDGEVRPATKEEWQAHVQDEYPWDRSLWMNLDPPTKP